jgi:Outer membrane protein and related peptidoglycan-associated (lipo)proteins
MKKFTTLILLVICGLSVFAQNSDYKWSVEASFGKNEYNGDIFNSYFRWDKAFYEQGGLGLNYYLDKNFDVGLLGTYGKYGALANANSHFLGKKLDISGLLKYKLNNGYILPENGIFAPYLTGGFGFANYSGGPRIYKSSAFILPLGVGLKFNVTKNVALQYQWLFNFNYSDKQDFIIDNRIDNFMKHSLGVVVSFGGKKDSDKDGVSDKLDACPGTPAGVQVDAKGCPVDSDGDGVADYLDKCPGTPAGVQVDASGCPIDSDKDGIADYLDKCPNTPANVKVDANGCPLDSDGDGVADYQDQCPNEKGKASTMGCPDRDNDGVADKDDKCPDVAGPASNSGCPVVEKQGIPNLLFATNKYAITPEHQIILSNVVKTLNENNDSKLQVNGHADSTGPDEYNQKLSEKRANSVKAYLVKKKIAAKRISTAGYGETQPVGDNNTEEGKAQNRRAELQLK